MSDLLIRGMEMPTNCYHCPFCDYVSARCDAVKGTPYTPISRYEVRADWCPLIPVPPHGGLIDEDVLIKTAHNQWPLPIDFLKLLELVPTVIPADGEDTNVTTREEEV